jgi:hypothetical protein
MWPRFRGRKRSAEIGPTPAPAAAIPASSRLDDPSRPCAARCARSCHALDLKHAEIRARKCRCHRQRSAVHEPMAAVTRRRRRRRKTRPEVKKQCGCCLYLISHSTRLRETFFFTYSICFSLSRLQYIKSANLIFAGKLLRHWFFCEIVYNDEEIC